MVQDRGAPGANGSGSRICQVGRFYRQKLRTHLIDTKGFAAEAVADAKRLQNWLQNQRRPRWQGTVWTPQERGPELLHIVGRSLRVGGCGSVARDTKYIGTGRPDQLWVHPDCNVSKECLWVPFTSHGMLKTLQRYRPDFVHLILDTKWKVLTNGGGVITLSLLLKDGLRHTSYHGNAGLVQLNAAVSRAFPVLQACTHSENTQAHVRLVEVLEELWSKYAPAGSKRLSLQQCVTQVHKDQLTTLETMREECFPNSRCVNDWFHFKQKKAQLAKKHKQQNLVNGKDEKRHSGHTSACLHALHIAPTLPIFSACWTGLLRRLEVDDEPEVAKYLRGCEACGSNPLRHFPVASLQTPEEAAFAKFVPWWSGIMGVYPGTGCGSEPQEAAHSWWQKRLEALQGKGSVTDCLKIMQKLYSETWVTSFNWSSDTALSVDPVRDPKYEEGPKLRERLQRSTAREFFEWSGESQGEPVHVVEEVSATASVVCMPCNVQKAPTDLYIARRGFRALCASGSEVRGLLQDAGILDEHGSFKLAAFNDTFVDVVYVLVSNEFFRCTCEEFGKYANCEHVMYTKSIPFTHRHAPLADFSMPASQRHRGGRAASLVLHSGHGEEHAS